MAEYSSYILPLALALAAFLVLPTVIKLVGSGVKTILVAIAITAILGSSAFATFKSAAEDRVDDEVNKRAASSATWQKVKTTKAEATELKRKLARGEAKVYSVAGVDQKCARKLAKSATPGGKATAYLLYCEDGKTYRVKK